MTDEVCRRHGIGELTFCRWKSNRCSIDPAIAEELRAFVQRRESEIPAAGS